MIPNWIFYYLGGLMSGFVIAATIGGWLERRKRRIVTLADLQRKLNTDNLDWLEQELYDYHQEQKAGPRKWQN